MSDIEIKTILRGLYELSKTADNPEYGNSYKLRCLNQKSKLQAISKGARMGLRLMGEEINEETGAGIEDDSKQMRLI